jgi:hypothetical protein
MLRRNPLAAELASRLVEGLAAQHRHFRPGLPIDRIPGIRGAEHLPVVGYRPGGEGKDLPYLRELCGRDLLRRPPLLLLDLEKQRQLLCCGLAGKARPGDPGECRKETWQAHRLSGPAP